MMTILQIGRRAFIASLALTGISLAAVPSLAGSAIDLSKRWRVTAEEARQLIADGAIVLDNRADDLVAANPLPNAKRLVWPQLTYPDVPDKGKLLDDDKALTNLLQSSGISADKVVINIADPINGWGEDGRLTWALRTLGHDKAVFVDGGYPALVAAGIPAIKEASVPGNFTVKRTASWEATRDDVKAAIGRSDVVILDTREEREFNGETPYGEQRGGHVPGARHLWYKDLIGEDGHLLPKDKLAAKLAALGVSPDKQVIAYCTGGIRSGFFTSALTDAGYSIRNYAGSMWDWSASDPEKYPLVN